MQTVMDGKHTYFFAENPRETKALLDFCHALEQSSCLLTFEMGHGDKEKNTFLSEAFAGFRESKGDRQ